MFKQRLLWCLLHTWSTKMFSCLNNFIYHTIFYLSWWLFQNHCRLIQVQSVHIAGPASVYCKSNQCILQVQPVYIAGPTSLQCKFSQYPRYVICKNLENSIFNLKLYCLHPKNTINFSFWCSFSYWHLKNTPKRCNNYLLWDTDQQFSLNWKVHVIFSHKQTTFFFWLWV